MNMLQSLSHSNSKMVRGRERRQILVEDSSNRWKLYRILHSTINLSPECTVSYIHNDILKVQRIISTIYLFLFLLLLLSPILIIFSHVISYYMESNSLPTIVFLNFNLPIYLSIHQPIYGYVLTLRL